MRPVATVTLPAIRLHPAPESAVFELLANITVPAGFGVLVTGFVLGIRHGIDWDHIAAITDITSTTAAAGMACAPHAEQHRSVSGPHHGHGGAVEMQAHDAGPGAATLAPVATISKGRVFGPERLRGSPLGTLFSPGDGARVRAP